LDHQEHRAIKAGGRKKEERLERQKQWRTKRRGTPTKEERKVAEKQTGAEARLNNF